MKRGKLKNKKWKVKQSTQIIYACWYLLVLICIATGTASAGKLEPSLPDRHVLDAFDVLVEYIKTIPQDTMGKAWKNYSLKRVHSAEDAYLKGDVCVAEKELEAFLSKAQEQRKGKRVAVAETLYSRGHTLIGSMFDIYYENVQMKPPPCFDPMARSAPELNIEKSDNKRFVASVTFGGPNLVSIETEKETWTQIGLPGIDSTGGPPGMPAVPFWRGLIAVPMGATAKLKIMQEPKVARVVKVNLYPFQPQVADIESSGKQSPAPPFAKDKELYGRNAFFPERLCSVIPLGQYRDMEIVQVVCAGGKYNPVTDELRLFETVGIEIQFEGGKGYFVTSQTMSPFEPSSDHILSSVLNRDAVYEYVQAVEYLDRTCAGEELLILTHPDFRDAAEDLAAWKEEKGIVTTIRDVGAGTAYETGPEIDDLIESRYDNCRIRPSYVLLLGDVEFIPPADTDYNTEGDYCSTCGDETTGSDYGYAIYPHFLFDALFPDFGVARMPVDTLAEAQWVVEKTINYEFNPPLIDFVRGAPFYTTAALAAQFQCCRMNADGSPLGGQDGRTQRSFIETAEIAREALTDAGLSAERIYMETIEPPRPGQLPYSGVATPNRYYNGNLLPFDLRDGSGFVWDGDTADVTNAFNDGRFLILHRDHGSSSGFAHPSFNTGDLPSLSNDDLLPVVYSVNCKSGYFDRETDTGGSIESFMERLLTEEDGGMVGGLGDVRNSPTWANSALTRGFFDATWPDLAPEYGSDTSIRRLADILNHGKVYMLTQTGVPQTAGSVSLEAVVAEHIMWHAFGDPTLEMWTRNPYRLVISIEHTMERLFDHLKVIHKTEGAIITAFQKTKDGMVPIGRGEVKNGMAIIPYFTKPDQDEPIILSASKENAVSVLLTK